MNSGWAEVLGYMLCLDSKHLDFNLYFSPNLCSKGGWVETLERQADGPPPLHMGGLASGLAVVYLFVVVDTFLWPYKELRLTSYFVGKV